MGFITIGHNATPANPDSGYSRVYIKSDGKLYTLDEYGSETEIGSGGAPESHASTHENGGADEISVAGLSGLLADGQTPLTHSSSHQSGGSDSIKLDDLAAPDDNTDLNASTSSHGLMQKYPGGTTSWLRADGSFSTVDDGYAIHDNVASEISAITEKASPVSGDFILIEDSADSNNKKRVQIGNLPTGTGDSTAIHDNVASEISAIAEKTAVVEDDLIIIEDSESSYAKKSVNIGNIPIGVLNSSDYYYLFDDFLGQAIDAYKWDTVASGGGAVTLPDLDGGQVQCVTAATANNLAYIVSLTDALKCSHGFTIEVGFRLNEVNNNYAIIEAYATTSERLRLLGNSANNYWRCQSQTASGSDTTNTSEALDTNFHRLRIVATSSSIKYYVDDTLVATHTTYITSELMCVRVGTMAYTTSAVTVFIDYVKVIGSRNYW